jgi:hypothetical protein
MHVSAYYQGLTFDKKGKSYMVNELNHMWFCDVFAEPFLTLVKKVGKEETQNDVLVVHRKWIPVHVGESTSKREVIRDLVVDVRVQYQQGEVKTCLFRSLASAFHHLHLQTQFWHPAIAMSFCTHSSAICIQSYGKFMVQLWHIFA